MLTRYVVTFALCAIFPAARQAQQSAPASCDQYEAAVRRNPDDVAAATRFGRCSFRDFEMVALGGDSSRLMFRSSWTPALRALRHAVAREPSYSPAYRALFAILFAENRDGCSAVTRQCTHVAPILRQGDSLITPPRLVLLNTPGVDTYDEVTRETLAGNRPSLMEARAIAERWAGVAPNDPRPHEFLGRALLRLGDPSAATAELERAALLGTVESRRNLFWDRIEALIRADRGADARRVLDEAAADPDRDTVLLRSYTLAALNAVVGRNRPPAMDSTRARQIRARDDSMIRSHAAMPPKAGFSQLLTAGDTAGARRVLAGLDSTLEPPGGVRRFPRVWSGHLASAESHLRLGDTAAAEARLAEIEDAFSRRPLRFSVGLMFEASSPWLGRAWLLSGDLAAARRRFPDAARMYRRLIGLWEGGDPELQPIVGDARTRLAALPAR